MPNNQVIEERIVEMRLDNKNFESGANKTISLLEKLEKALHIKSSSKELDEAANSIGRLGDAANKFNANGMVDGLEKVKNGFTALEIVGMRTISNLTDSIYNFTARTLKSFTVEPIQQGFNKYGEKTTAVATLTAQGYELEKVNQLMEDLNWFTDETSYNFTDMVGNIAKFTATGQDLDESVTAMEGIALWAALSGQNAQKASMAMYQLSQAMGKGALKYDDYKSIQNASMDTQEFRKQAVAAAESLGILKQSAEGLWEVVGEGKEFDLAGLFSSDALSRTEWFTSDVMMKVFNQYSKAVGEVQRYMDEHDIDTASEAMRELEASAKELADRVGISLDEAFKQLGYDLDEFSLKALKAGQNARTWADVVDSVKDAVSTGWMATFEKFFGDAETATTFWTNLANDFYDIFAEGGNKRNSILEKALLGKTEGLNKTASATKNLVSGWEKLEKRLESSGHDMSDFEKALIKVSDEGTIEAVRGFGSVEEALKNGAFSADIFKRALAELTGETTEASSEVESHANASAKSLEDMRQVALEVLRGDHGNGQERIDWLKANGYDPELIQAMAGQLKWFGSNVSDERLIDLMEAYYRFNNLGDRLGAKTFAEYVEASSKVTDDVEATNDDLSDAESLYDAVVNGVDETAEGLEEAKTGGELFRESLLNIVALIKSIQDVSRAAFEKIFGNEDAIANGIYKVIKGFHSFTEAIQLNEDQSVALNAVFMGIFAVIKGVGKVAGVAIRVFGALFQVGLSVLTFVGQLIGKLKENNAIQHFASALYNLFDAIAKPASLIVHYIDLMTRPFRKSIMPKVLEKLAHYIGIISIRADYLTRKFNEFMTSDEMFMRITNAFRSLVSYFRIIKDTVSNFQVGTFLGGIWNTAKNLFASVSNFVRSGDLSSFSGIAQRFKELGASISQIKIGQKTISDIFQPVTNFLTNIFGDPQELKTTVSNAITTALSGIQEGFKKAGITDIFKAIRLAGLTVLLSEVSSILRAFKKIEDEVSGIPEALAGVFKSVSGVLDEYKKSFKANYYLKMAAAIAVLAGSLWLLSKIPADELTHVAVVMGVLILVLSVLAKNLQGIVKVIGGDKGDKIKINVFNGLAAKLIGLAAVILSVVAMLAAVKKSNPMSVALTIVGMVVLIGGLALVLRELSEMKFADTKGLVATMLSLGLAIQMLIIPIAALAAIPFTKYLQGVLGVAAIAAVLATVLFVFSRLDNKGNTSNIMKVAGAMSLIAVALLLMVVPFTILAAIPVDNFGKALASMLGLLALLALIGAAAAVIGKMNNGKGLIAAAAAMVIIAFGINILVPAILSITTAIVTFAVAIPWETLTDRIAAFHDALAPFGELAIILIGFGIALTLMGIGAAGLGIGVLTGATGVLVFAAALYVLSKMVTSLGEALPGFIENLAKTGELITLDTLWNIAKGAIAFGALAAAIFLLAKGLGALFSHGNVGSKISSFTSAIVSGLGGIFKTIGDKFVTAVPTLLKIFGTLAILVGLYFVGIIPQLTDIIVKAIITLFESIYNSVQKNKGAFERSIFGIVATFLEILLDTGTWVITVIRGLISSIVSGLLGWIADQVEDIPILGKKVANSIRGIADRLPDAEELMSQWNNQKEKDHDWLQKFIPPPEEFKSAADETVAAVGESQAEIDAALASLKESTGEITEAFKVDSEETGKEMDVSLGQGLLSNNDGGLLSAVSELKTSVFGEDFLGGFGLNSEGVGIDMNSFLGSGFLSENASGLLPSIDTMKENANTSLSGLTSDGFASGENFAIGINNGFASWANNGTLELNIKTVADNMVKWLNTGLGEESPSKYTEKSGRYFVEGLTNGIADESGSAITEVVGFGSELISAMSTAMARVAYIASDDFSISPTITPVVDMSNARMAAGSMNTMFGSNYRSYVDGITARAGDVSQSIDYNLQNKEVVSEVRSLSSRLDLLGDKIANMQIVLDSGLMVGAMAPQMDSRLGQIAVRKGRGN